MALAEEEALAEGVVRVEGELVRGRAPGAALDLGDDRGAAGDLGVPDDPGAELRPDHALVDELLAAREFAGALEKREARGGAAPARRAVDLAVGEDGDVPLPHRRPEAHALPEDHAVHVAELGLERVDEGALRLETGLHR